MSKEEVGEQEKVSEENTTSDEESFIDQLKAMRGFVSKHRNTLTLLALILIPFFLGMYFRIAPATLPFTEDYGNFAVDNAIRQQTAQRIANEYPFMNPADRSAIVQKEAAAYKKQNKKEYDEAVKRISNEYKKLLKDPPGQTYLMSIDPYLWLRKAENVIKYGHVGNTKKEKCDKKGKCTLQSFDTYLLAPDGDFVTVNLYPYLIAYTWAFLHFFIRSLSMLTVLFYMPVFLGALATIPVFFITKRFTKNNTSSFIAAIITGIHKSYIQRTHAGFSDTDAFSVLFPLFIFWLLLISMDKKSNVHTAGISCIAGLITGAYSIIWGGWWFIFDAFMIASATYMGYMLLLYIRKKDLKNLFKSKKFTRHLSSILPYIASTGLFVTLFSNFERFVIAPSILVKTAIGLKAATQGGIWPNVYTTITELQSLTFDKTIEKLGGSIFLFCGFIGMFVLLSGRVNRKTGRLMIGATLFYMITLVLKNTVSTKVFIFLLGVPIAALIVALLKNKQEEDIFPGALIAVWICGMIFASINAQRFAVVIIPGLAICVGIFLHKIEKFLGPMADKHLKIKGNWFYILFVIIAILSLAIPNAGPLNNGPEPIFDDGWYNTLNLIKKESAPDAIIASWWDFGHFFKTVGDRRIIFDGGTQNRPQAHWMSRVFVTDNGNESISILRMLACGGNGAFDLLDKDIQDTAKTVRTLYTLFEKDKKEGTDLLRRITKDQEKAKKIAEKIYCDPPEMYFILSSDMIQKMHAYTKFGFWNFDKAKMWRDAQKLNKEDTITYLKSEFKYDTEKAEEITRELRRIGTETDAIEWISPIAIYAAGIGGCQTYPEENNSLQCISIGGGPQVIFKVNQDTKKANFENTKEKEVLESVVWVDENNTFRVTKPDLSKEDTLSNVTLALIPDQNSLGNIHMMPKLGKSMYTRLYFFNDPSLKHFRVFHVENRAINRGPIKVWKIDWDLNSIDNTALPNNRNNTQIADLTREVT